VGAQIGVSQNEPAFLRLVAAARHRYDTARRLHRARAYMTIAVAILGPVAVLVQPSSKGVVGLLGGVTVIASWVLRQTEPAHAEAAARVQELFDTNLFELRWNRILVGPKPTNEEMIADARRSRVEGEKLKDWYVDPSPLESPFSVLLCQRSSCVWDRRQRERYGWLVLATTIVGIVGLAAFAWFRDMRLADYVTALMIPAMSAYLLGFETFRDMQRTAQIRRQLEGEIEELIEQELVQRRSMNVESLRDIQDRLFLLRSRPGAVPQWLYDWVRIGFQEDMAQAVNDYRETILERLNKAV
jgi:hypothetical protein